jgi:hypothetical protein
MRSLDRAVRLHGADLAVAIDHEQAAVAGVGDVERLVDVGKRRARFTVEAAAAAVAVKLTAIAIRATSSQRRCTGMSPPRWLSNPSPLIVDAGRSAQ